MTCLNYMEKNLKQMLGVITNCQVFVLIIAWILVESTSSSGGKSPPVNRIKQMGKFDTLKGALLTRHGSLPEDRVLVRLRKDVNVCINDTTLQKCLISYDLHMIFHSNDDETKAGKKYRFPGFHYIYQKNEPMVRATKTVAQYQLYHIILKRLENREK